MINLEELRTYALSLAGTSEDIKWGNDLCFTVGTKLFFVVGLHLQPPNASFKTDPEQAITLVNKPGFSPAPYLAKHHWVLIDDINKISLKEWKAFISHSYELIVSKLPKRVQTSLASSRG